MESFQITLNSDFADVKNTVSDVVFYLPNLVVDTQTYIYVSVISAQIPYSFYNINDTNNNLYFFNPAGDVTTITIPNGNYNVKTFMNYLLTKFSYITMTYNSTSNKYLFSADINFTIASFSNCLQFLGFKQLTNPIDNFVSAYNETTGKYELESTIPINMSYYQYFYIYSNLTTYNFSKYPDINKTKLLCSIPIDVSPNGMIIYKNHNNFRSNTYSSMITDLKIKICDEDGDLIDLNDNSWTIVLQFDIVKFNDEE